jgi:hypothetical protein
MSDEEGMECAATYREIFLDNKKTMIVQPFPHVIETLRALHRQGYVLGMASSRNHCSLDGYASYPARSSQSSSANLRWFHQNQKLYTSLFSCSFYLVLIIGRKDTDNN